MTVILGVNLSDKLYLSGDSRLSYVKNDKLLTRHDNMQKVENIYGKRVITVASGGDARFASFVLNKFKTDDISFLEIGELRKQIESWIGKVAHEYFTIYGNSSVTFIFGGSNSNKKKIISGKHFREMANAYTGGKGLIRANNAINDLFQRYKHIPTEDLELNVPETQLFSIEISPSSLNVTDTKWGEFLMYGSPGLTREDIAIKDIASFEFNPSFINNGSGVGNDIALLNAFIYSQAKKNNLGGVGGSVVSIENNSDGTCRILSAKTYMYDPEDVANMENDQPITPADAELINTIDVVDNDHIFREVDGQRYQLIPVSKYIPKGTSSMVL